MIVISRHNQMALVFRDTDELEQVGKQLLGQAAGRRKADARGVAVYSVIPDNLETEECHRLLNAAVAAGSVYLLRTDVRPNTERSGRTPRAKFEGIDSGPDKIA